MIPPRQLPIGWDAYEILAALAPDATDYLGIGVQEGICVQHVVLAHTAIHLTLCDTWGWEHGGTGRGSGDHVRQRVQDCGGYGRLRLLDGRSQDLVPALPSDATFDLIYVDGAHDVNSEATDLANSWVRLRPGGALVVHDVKMDQVWLAILRWADWVGAAGGYTLSVALGGHGTLVAWRHL